MILSVYGLEEELKMVRLYLGSMLEGIRFGKSPITPVNVTVSIVRHDAAKALRYAFPREKTLMQRSASTARRGIANRMGVSIKLE